MTDKLINDLVTKSGLNNEKFAEAVGIKKNELSNKKRNKHINLAQLKIWAKTFDIEVIEAYSKDCNIKIEFKK